MNTSRYAFSSIVVSPIHWILGFIFAGGLLAVLWRTGLFAVDRNLGLQIAIPVLASLFMVATGIHVGTVRVLIAHDQVVCGNGFAWRLDRTIPASCVVDARSIPLNWAQTFGIGVRGAFRATRLTIKPGNTLELNLTTGEVVRISVKDPAAAIQIIKYSRAGPTRTQQYRQQQGGNSDEK